MISLTHMDAVYKYAFVIFLYFSLNSKISRIIHRLHLPLKWLLVKYLSSHNLMDALISTYECHSVFSAF